MKALIRNTFINALSLFLLSQVISGISITGGIITYILAGFCLTLLFALLKPILAVISFPLNVVTLGFFSVVTNGILFYLLTVFIPNVTIRAFTFTGASYAGFTIPKIEVNTFFSFIVIAILQSLLFGIIKWIIRR